MSRYLVDTDVLIDHQKGQTRAHDFLEAINQPGNLLFLSVVTLAELYAGISFEGRKLVQRLVDGFEVVVMDRLIAEAAASYLYDYQKKCGLGLGDAVIAATAYYTEARLVTRNRKHFPMKEVQLHIPY